MTYTVKPGDTLSEIAKMYETTVEALVASNGIKNPDIIHIGQVLNIPTTNNQLYNAFITCIDAISDLPEFITLCEILGV